MTNPSLQPPAFQLLEVAPELPASVSITFSHPAEGVPKTLIYRILRKGEVRVNKGRIKPNTSGCKPVIYHSYCRHCVWLSVMSLSRLSQGLLQRLEAAIVYEDKALIVLNKPAGIAVHGGSGLNYGVIGLPSVASGCQGY